MSPRHARRGAVHVMFLIVVLVMTLAFAFLWFTQLQQNEELRTQAQTAQTNYRRLENEVGYTKLAYREVAQYMGGGIPVDLTIPEGVGRGEPITPSSPEQLGNVTKKYLNDLREISRTGGEESAAPKTAFDALTILRGAYTTKVQENTVLAQQLAAQKAEVEAQRTAVAAADKRRNEDVATVTSEKDNNTARLTQQVNELTGDRDTLQNKLREATTAVQTSADTHNRDINAERLKTQELDAAVGSIKSQYTMQRATMTPDGSVLTVNRSARTMFIDRGSRDLLRRGTRFQVFATVKGGDKVLRGTAVVTSVGPTQSEARIEAEEPGQRIVDGDWIYNPYFEKGRTTRFVFLGNLGTMSADNAKRILERMGAKVDDKVTVETDFLVLGSKDTPEAEELTESQVYKDALRWGIQVLRARDLDVFLQQ
ncbi:MAG TPA: BRCT domain-containing protein [Planctomycetota bacterium]|nr:BRCT domain-containing protein [Planctomycetota bacterium]